MNAGVMSAPVLVGGFLTSSLSRKQLADRMVGDCLQARSQGGSSEPKLVFSSNGQGIALAGRSEAFAETMAAADIIHADGMSVVFASRFTNCPLPERIATTDFFHDAAAAAISVGLKFFLLGGKPEELERAAAAARLLYPQLQIAGTHHGYFAESDDARICGLVTASGADVLWVGLGKPHQESWSVRNRERLRGIGWIKTCGGLYSFLANEGIRAPGWMQKCGLEWLYRAVREPRRLGIRYLTTNPYALYRLIRHTQSPPGASRRR